MSLCKRSLVALTDASGCPDLRKQGPAAPPGVHGSVCSGHLSLPWGNYLHATVISASPEPEVCLLLLFVCLCCLREEEQNPLEMPGRCELGKSESYRGRVGGGQSVASSRPSKRACGRGREAPGRQHVGFPHSHTRPHTHVHRACTLAQKRAAVGF